MQYITAQEAAEKWGISLRNVQRLLCANRISGAQKYGRSWMIPVGVEKPIDLRKTRKIQQDIRSPYLTCVLLSAVLPMPKNNPDAVLLTLPDEKQRAQYAAELAYLRGDFDTVKSYFVTVSLLDNTYLCAANITICAAMSTQDYPLFKKIATSVKEIEENAPPRK